MLNIDHRRAILGSIINMEIWIFLAVNIVCLVCIYRGRLCAFKNSPVYVISGLNIMTETIQLLVHMFYIGPMIFIGDWLFPSRDSQPVIVISYIFLLLWFVGSCTQIVMAINRLCAVCVPSWSVNRHHMLIAFAIACIVGTAINTYSEVLAPCCKITPDFNYYGYSYMPVENVTRNYSLEITDVNFDVFTSVFCGSSYLMVFLYLRKMGGNSDLQLRDTEFRLCVQFLAVFVAYTVAWFSFFVLPEVGVTEPSAYAVTSICLICNCGINALVYLLLNKDVQFELNKMCGKSSNVVADSTMGFPSMPSTTTQNAATLSAA